MHPHLKFCLACVGCVAWSLFAMQVNAQVDAERAQAAKPLVRDFLGINGHFPFRPRLYAPVVSLARNYHPVEWDVGADTARVTEFPFARNRVNWEQVYGSWRDEGFRVDSCLMFANIEQKAWKNPAEDARRYGKAFATAFGPSSSRKLVTSAEIGNEPGEYDDGFYRTIFESMAMGLREGDPQLRIATCNVVVGESHRYAKSVECVRGLEKHYDVLNIHTYAEAEPWPTWRRSYPEDPGIPYLKEVEKLIAWRDEHAPGKQVWITEFGWDSSTKTAEPTGDFAKWVGVTDLQQAQYLVRSTLVFMTLDVQRAYIYFYDDEDKPSLHASSGITRNFKPKPSYHALAHLQKILGAYRLTKVHRQSAAESYIYEFAPGEQAADGKAEADAVLVAWSPTGSGRAVEATIQIGNRKLIRAERMPTSAEPEPAEAVQASGQTVQVKLTESPLYLLLEE